MEGKKIEFYLLSEEQVFNRFNVQTKQIDVIKKLGPLCAISDFGILLGNSELYDCNVMGDRSLKGRSCSWYLDNQTVVNRYGGYEEYLYGYGREYAIRPVLPYSENTDLKLNGTLMKNGFIEVEYGEYPQYAVNKMLSKKLESKFLEGRLVKTGKTYTTDSRKLNEYLSPFEPLEHEEYEYNGKRYIRVKNINEKPYKLSDGKIYNKGDAVWLEVAPIKWIVDENAKILVSKIALVCGIRFFDRGKNGYFKNSEMYQFLNTYFAKDILSLEEKMKKETKEVKTEIELQPSKKEQKRSQFQIEIDNILEEIKKYSQDFQNKELLKTKINNILEEYNKKLENVEYNTFLYNRETLKKELIIKLTQILYKLKLNNSNNEVFYNAINNIEQMIELLKEKDDLPESEKDISLVKDIKKIVTICLPYIRENDKQEITGEMLTILEKEKTKLKENLMSIESLEDKILLTDTKKLEYFSLENFELILREKLQPILIKLKAKVDNKSVEIETNQKLSEIIEDEFETSKDTIVSTYLNEINKMKENILDLLIRLPEVYDVYENKVNEIITKEIDYTNKLEEILKEIQIKLLSLYKLELEIKLKIENKNQERESKIQTRL